MKLRDFIKVFDGGMDIIIKGCCGYRYTEKEILSDYDNFMECKVDYIIIRDKKIEPKIQIGILK